MTVKGKRSKAVVKVMVTITRKEYVYLTQRDAHLSYLEELGVDNWEGYCRPDFDEDGNIIEEDDE